MRKIHLYQLDPAREIVNLNELNASSPRLSDTKALQGFLLVPERGFDGHLSSDYLVVILFLLGSGEDVQRLPLPYMASGQDSPSPGAVSSCGKPPSAGQLTG